MSAEPVRGPWPEPGESTSAPPWALSLDQVRAALAAEPTNLTYRRLWWEMTGQTARDGSISYPPARRPWSGGTS